MDKARFNVFAYDVSELRKIVSAAQDRAAARRRAATEPTQYVRPVQYAPPIQCAPPPPTVAQLRITAEHALQYFLTLRNPPYLGRPWPGAMTSRVMYPREGGQFTVAMERLHAEIPHNVDLSACPQPLPAGFICANATTPYASLRVALVNHDTQLCIDMAWDSV